MTLKILYGVQGTGNGHLARTRALLPALQKKDVEIDFVFSGRKREDFFDMNDFGDYKIFQGLTFSLKRGKVQVLKTLLSNNFIRLLLDILRLKVTNYDLVISDFEPVTAWSARFRGKHCISLSHQCAFHYEVPKAPGYWLSRYVMRIFAPGKTKVGFHYDHFNQSVLPPLISAKGGKIDSNGTILVYMAFEKIEDIVSFLSGFPSYNFEVFARVEKQQKLGNVTINPFSVPRFHEKLLSCDGVISNAGFELPSECLKFGKKLLVKPLSGQYEQLCNVVALEVMGRATSMKSLDRKVLNKWLTLPQQQPLNYPEFADKLADWLVDPNRENITSLSKKIWGDAGQLEQFSGST